MFILNLRARGRFGHSVDESICNEGGFFSSGQIEMSSQREIDGPPLIYTPGSKWTLRGLTVTETKLQINISGNESLYYPDFLTPNHTVPTFFSSRNSLTFPIFLFSPDFFPKKKTRYTWPPLLAGPDPPTSWTSPPQLDLTPSPAGPDPPPHWLDLTPPGWT